MSVIQLPVVQPSPRVGVSPEHDEHFRAELASIDPKGKRRWIYARKPKGVFYRARTVLSWFLLVFLIAGPFVSIHGHQLLLFDVTNGEFVLFGVPFWPDDFYLIALLFLLGLVSLVILTATLGRIWCGWLCPQTIFLEMFFRKVEWLIEGSPKEQERRNEGPWTWDRSWRFGAKQSIFVIFSFVIANAFLAYFVSSKTLLQYVNEGPFGHIELFVALVAFTVVFYLVFARFREQACLIVCPYGRYMSALVDENTISVTYDFKRGEERSKWQRSDDRRAKSTGHCVDCFECVRVCPTGIDIRDGIQLECVACTACIDACDSVMEKVGLPKGLVRYTSASAVQAGTTKWLTPRIVAYFAMWVVLIGAVSTLFAMRNLIDVNILRSPGTTWTRTADGIANFYDIRLINKSTDDFAYTIEVPGVTGATVTPLGLPPIAHSGDVIKGRFLINIPDDRRHTEDKRDLVIVVRSNTKGEDAGRGGRLREITTTFLAPEADGHTSGEHGEHHESKSEEHH